MVPAKRILSVLLALTLCLGAAGCAKHGAAGPADGASASRAAPGPSSSSGTAVSGTSSAAGASVTADAASRAAFEALAAKIFRKPYAEVTQSDYGRLKAACVGDYDGFYYLLDQTGSHKEDTGHFSPLFDAEGDSRMKAASYPALTRLWFEGEWSCVPFSSVSGLKDALVSHPELLSRFTGLEFFSFTGHPLKDIGFLRSFSGLWFLDLTNTQLRDTSFLSSLPLLRYFTAPGNAVGTVARPGPQLRVLNLGSSSVTDVSALASATALTYVNLKRNAIADISALSHWNGLVQADLYANKIKDLGPLARSSAPIEAVELSFNGCSDLAPLGTLAEKDKKLIGLFLQGNGITDISPLRGAVQLGSLDLSGNSISDISALSGLKNLGNLRLADNPLKSIAPLHLPADMRSSHYSRLDLSGTPFSSKSYSFDD